jgi:hypothetical protein
VTGRRFRAMCTISIGERITKMPWKRKKVRQLRNKAGTEKISTEVSMYMIVLENCPAKSLP